MTSPPDAVPAQRSSRISPVDDSSTASDEDDWSNSPFDVASTPITARRLSTESRIERDQSIAARLPSELLLEIFKFLPAMSDIHATLLTCRSWCECSVETLWYKPSMYTATAFSKFLKTLKRNDLTFEYALFVRRLNLSYIPDEVTDAALYSLRVCQKLERMTLVHCNAITDRGLCDVLCQNTGLIALDLSNLDLITDLSVLVIASRNRALQGLNLSGCNKVTDDAVISIAKNCRHLRRLKLNNCMEIHDRSIHEIARHSRYLLEIDLDRCYKVTSASVNELLHRCPELRELRLNMCGQIDDECFANMERDQYQNLRSLDLTGCSRITDESVLHIATAAPRLRTLVLAKCPNITDRGAVQIARLGKNIHFLHLGHCSQLTDRSISFLAKYCNRLRYIDLACCVQLTDSAVSDLAELPRLKRIGLVKCSEITPDSIFALVEKNTVQHTLERIHLSYCTNLQIDCIRELLNACKRLTHISLTGVPAFLRPDLTQFCRPSPKEFNPAQASVFCVFSADGVKNLRRHLNIQFGLQSSLQGEWRILEDMAHLEVDGEAASAREAADDDTSISTILG